MISSSIIAVISFLPLFFSSFAIGNLLLGIFRLNKKYSKLEEVIFSLLLGFAFYSYVTFFLGLIGLLYLWIYVLIVAISLIVYRNRLMIFTRYIIQSIKSIKVHADFNTLLKVVILIFSISAFISALTPPFLWDEMDYRLGHPRLWASEHELVFLPSRWISELPSNVDLLYVVGFVFGGAAVSKLFSLSINILLAAAIYSFGKRFYNSQIGILGTSIYLTIPLVMNHIGSAYVDIPVASIVFIAFYCFALWLYRNQDNFAYLGAVFIGYAGATKNTALVPAAILALFVIFHSFKKKKFLHSLKIIFIFGLISFSMLAPWYAKTYFRTGNPIWPFAYDLLGGTHWDSRLSNAFTQDLGIAPPLNIVNFVLIPWNITMHSSQFSVLLGWNSIFLAFIPLLFFFKKIDKIAWNAITYSILVFYAVLLFSYNFSGVLRYVMTYSFFCVLSALVIYEILKVKYLRNIAVLCLVVSFAFTAILWMGIFAAKVPYVLGMQSEAVFYSKLNNANGYNIHQYILQNLPESSMIFMFRDSRNYLNGRNYILGHPLDQKIVDYRMIKGSDDFYRELKKNNVTHVFINDKIGLFKPQDKTKNRTNAYTVEHQAFMDKMLKEHGKLLIADDGIYLYELS